MKEKYNPPFAPNLIESMRSIGYSFSTALADIIDNSIAANATVIRINSETNGDLSYVSILDNGNGMTDNELFTAMRYGSFNPTEERKSEDMGRFGLGLKSASLSQCRKLTVISKKNNITSGYIWDIDYVIKTGEWTLQQLDENEIERLPTIENLIAKETGTIVLWEHFDRILKSSNNMDTYLQELLVKSIDHFSLIYHRLIGSKLKIYVNGFEVIPSDPFLESNKSTQLKREQRIMIDNNVITVKPYILPHVNKLSTDDIKKVGGKESLRNNQGFYIYRNKRLIIWGTWFRLGNKEELFKLARVKVDVPNSLDYLWDIDIKKSKAVLPEKIKTNLYNAVLESCEISENVHIYKGKKVNNQNYQHMWNVIEKRKESLTLEINTDNPLVTKFVDTLDENQKKIFKFLINDIENNIPLDYIYSQIAKGKNSNQELSIDEKDIIVENIKNQLNNYENIGITRNELIGILMQQEQYAKDEYILSKLEELREDCNVSEY